MDLKARLDQMAAGRARERHQGKRRSRTIAARRLGRVDFSDGIQWDEELEALRPKTRADCKDGERPCPWVGCKYHLWMDVNPKTGSIKINFPDIEPDEMAISCVLDVADEGPVTLEEVGKIMNLTRERIRQLEAGASEKLRTTKLAVEYREYSIEGKPYRRDPT
ncbi:MAG: sigma factor-like helix-turn-helix DNA-binding protein [Myxococcota bacterium]|jgi:hypothetical protein